MAEYLHPGVYVEEVSSGVRPIEGVGTSTAGFVGVTAKGVPNRATFITSWTEFVRKFGYLIPGSYLPYAVSQFFENGGKRCYVVRVLNDASAVAAQVDLPSRQTPTRATLRVRALGSGARGNDLTVRIEDGTENPTREFKIVVLHEGKVVEVFDNLSMDTAAINYVETEINGSSEYVEVEDRDAHVVEERAERVSADPLADPVPFAGGGETFVIEMPDGTTDTVNFAGNTARADVLTAVNAAWGPLNVTATLNAANRLVITHNTPGYDRYFILSGTATGAGRPLDGLAGFDQGRGPAIGAVLKSASAATFDTTGGNDGLQVTVRGEALALINLPVGAATPVADVLGAIRAAFDAPAAGGLVTARQEGNRIVISTVNRGAVDASLAISGTADTPLQFRRFDRGGLSGDTINGQGQNEPAFIQSDPGPFTLQDNAAFSLAVNNGVLGASTSFNVTFNAAALPNLQQVTAQQVAATITAAAPAGTVNATVINNRVVVRQTREGNYYTLRLTDGLHSPNVRLGFEAFSKSGYAEGDRASPYLRPGFNTATNEPWPLGSGDDGSPVSDFDYIGTADAKTGLHAFDDVDDVNFIAIPGNSSVGVIGQAVGYCTTRGDCFFIADSPAPQNGSVTEPAEVRSFLLNDIPTKTSYGALYYPWVLAADPVGAGRNPTRLLPPSGYVAGLYARIDTTRGVWKAPAGTEATIFGALGLEFSVTDAQQDILNPPGVNCLRRFAAAGLVIWGARTLGAQSDPEWRYIPVRRYAIYLRVSIYRGTQWAVFEPNDAPLWEQLTNNITDFMMGEFRKGALAGRTPDEAFRVKCDADLNPPSEVNAGRVNMEVKFAPLKPAEFVIIRISQKIQQPGG